MSDERLNARAAGRIYIHDCERCTYLGPFQHDGTKYDLYHCMECDKWPTVVARYGDDGPEYTSGMEFAERGLTPSLVEAMKRAEMIGLETRKNSVVER